MKNWFKTNTDSSPKDKKWWKPNISWLKLDKWVKRLDIYIIKKFLGTYFFAIALIISIAVVFDVNENIDRFINNKAPLKAIVFDYYMNFIPYFSNLFSPLFVFIAVIFFTSKLAENSEIIAMFSTGMSFKRMMRPYMISAAIISVVTFGLGAYVIPKGNVTRLDFEDRYKKKKKQEYVRNVQLEVDSVSLSSRKMKGGMGLHLGVGLALSFSYILFQTVSATFAVNGNTPPIIAVWIPNILYTFIAIYLYRKAPK